MKNSGPGRKIFPEQVLSPYVGQHGYLVVAIQRHMCRKKYLVHRLIGLTFISGYAKGLSINHINGVKTDNRLENLEWVSIAENTRKQWQTGLVDLRGQKHPSSKLSDEKVIEAVERIKSGEKVHAIAKEFMVSDSLIYQIMRGKKKAFLFQNRVDTA